ncbi:MAG: 16S rRNA (guanine(966)-N(2))-methyltransferase RsmD, partial [Niabella sp.]
QKLQVPDSAKPTMERVKLAIFSMLGDEITGAKCLDLFAGSGNLGFEALSRGAASCDFIENDFFAIKSLKENLQKLENTYQEELPAKIIKNDALKYINDLYDRYDLIFIDPPYKENHIIHLFKTIDEVLAPTGKIIYLSENILNLEKTLPQINESLKITDQRQYSKTFVQVLQIKGRTL